MQRRDIDPETRKRVDIILKRNARLFANTGKNTPKTTMKRVRSIEKRSYRYFRHLAPQYFDDLLRSYD